MFISSFGRTNSLGFSSVLFSLSVMSNTLQAHGLQHAMLPYPSITNSQGVLKLICIKSVIPSNHLILCHPLRLLHSIFSRIRVFSNESVLCIRWPKYWSFSSASVLPMKIQNHWFPLGLTGLIPLCLSFRPMGSCTLCSLTRLSNRFWKIFSLVVLSGNFGWQKLLCWKLFYCSCCSCTWIYRRDTFIHQLMCWGYT